MFNDVCFFFNGKIKGNWNRGIGTESTEQWVWLQADRVQGVLGQCTQMEGLGGPERSQELDSVVLVRPY